MDIITPYIINDTLKDKIIDIDLNKDEKEELLKIIYSKLFLSFCLCSPKLNM